MAQPGGGLGFAEEPLDDPGVALELGVGNFECDVAVEGRVNRAVDDAPATGAQALLDHEAADFFGQGDSPGQRRGHPP